MIKNIKFHEAVEQMKAGDIFRPYDSEFGTFEMSKKGYFQMKGVSGFSGFILLCKEHFNLVGDIIPTDPKILMAEESWEKNGNFIIKEFQSRKDIYEIGFINGHQNGRLERDLEVRELIKAVGNDEECLQETKELWIDLPPLNKNV